MRDSLRTRLTAAFVLLTILPVLLAGLVWAQQSYQVQRQQAFALQGEVAERVATTVDAFVSGVESQLNLLTSVKSLGDLPVGEQAQQMASLLAYEGSFADIVLLNKDGRETIHLSRLRRYSREELGDRAGQDEFQVPSQTGETYIGPIRFDQVLGEPLVTVAVPLWDSTGQQFRGVLSADVRLKKIWDAIAAIPVSQGESVYVVGPDGRVVAHRSPATVLRGRRFDVPEQNGVYPGLDAPQVLLVTRAVDWGEQVLHVVVEKDTAQAFGLARSALLVVGVVILIGVGVALLAGLFSVRRLLRPIDSMVLTAQSLAAGDFGQEVEVRRQDEIGRLGTALNQMAAQLRDLVRGLEQRVADRTRDLERRSSYLAASAEVSRAAAVILESDVLIREVVDLIQQRFDLYYVGLFLVDDDGEWAVLQAGTGLAGLALLGRGHRIRVGQGMVGWSIAHAQARVAGEASLDALRLATPELPDTRSEAALPLRSRGQVIGALTVQDRHSDAFDAEAIAALQVMADQVAVSIDNARLLAESREALAAERRAYGEISGSAWRQMASVKGEWGYRCDQQGISLAEGRLRGDMELALAEDREIVAEGDATQMAIPIRVREQSIGVLSFIKPGPEAWTVDEMSMLSALTDQLGVALESARLYEETQRRAAQERLIGEVTARIRETLDMDTVLQTAVRQVGEALGIAEVEVRLADPAQLHAPISPAGDGNGSAGGALT